MSKAQDIEKFVKMWFDVFHLDYRKIVGIEENEEEKMIDAPIAVGDELVMENVERSAEALGVTADDILIMKDSAVRGRLKKFSHIKSYISLLTEYGSAVDAGFYAPGFALERLRAVIWGGNHAVKNLFESYPLKYDFESVPNRLIALLKEYNEVFPGTYHTGASIQNLKISTGHLFHFSKIGELCRQFLSFVDRAEELFFKALQSRLTKTEISEYNLLVSYIGLQDAYMPSKDRLYYSTLMARREVYRKENLTDFFSYVRLSWKSSVRPYRCAEFISDLELVQRFVSIYPKMKAEMRKFAHDVENYRCVYRWSDEPPRGLSDDAITAYLEGKISYDELMSETGLCVSFVPKTPAELGGDREAAEKLRILSGPEALGGLADSALPYHPKLDIPRMSARIEADHKADGGVSNG